MPYFHVRITTKSGSHSPEVELDVGPDELKSRFLEPYKLGRPIVIAGRPNRSRTHPDPQDSR